MLHKLLIGLFLLVNHFCYGLKKKGEGSVFDTFQSVIIAGTQKSGTTVLAAYLSQHPNISLSDTKELHFFDKAKTYKKGMDYYYSKFFPNKRTIYIGEATPSYIASRSACHRISRDIPNAKLIVLLREPVSRAYSEYQMKARRVSEHTEFIRLIDNHTHTVHNCLLLYADDFGSFKECLPRKIRNHGRYGKLKKGLSKAYDKLHNWEHVRQLCFTNYSADSADHKTEYTLNMDGDSYVSAADLRFHPERCWSYYKEGYENVMNMSAAFIQEVEDFKQCANYSSFNMKNWDTEATLQTLEDAVDNCLHIKSGISSLYFYRSLYAVQLFHCYKFTKQSISKEKILIIGSEELRSRPSAVMMRVLNFLNLPEYDLEWLPLQKETLNSILQSQYSTFEKTTSWRLNSEYDPMPTEYASYLQAFFSPMNSLLFQLINMSTENAGEYW